MHIKNPLVLPLERIKEENLEERNAAKAFLFQEGENVLLKDRIFHRLIRSPKSSEVANSSHNSSAFAFDSTILKFNNTDFDYDPTNSDSDISVCISKFSLDNMANNYEQAQSYELKYGLIDLLPKFHGLASEDPQSHLKEFHGNIQQFGVRGFVASKVVISNQRLENKITELTSLVRQLAIRQHHISPPMKMCGICAFIEHPTDVCSTLQETKLNNVEVATMMGS
ncbi:hypothetical protein CR513_26435, partial [Mucuna pruriens]